MRYGCTPALCHHGDGACPSPRPQNRPHRVPSRNSSSRPRRKRSPQAKSKAEFDAYKAAAAQTDPAKLEAAATDFAQKFPASELRSLLFQQAMGLYQQANNSDKTLEMARAVLKYEPTNPVALLTAAQILVERTHDDDLDRNDRLDEATTDARDALQHANDCIAPATSPPSSLPPPSRSFAARPTR